MEVLAVAVVLEADAAGVEVGLGEGAVGGDIHPGVADLLLQGAGVARTRPVAGEAEEGIDHLRRIDARRGVAQARGLREVGWLAVGGGAMQDDVATLRHRADGGSRRIDARVARTVLHRGHVMVRERARVASRGGDQVDDEGEVAQRVRRRAARVIATHAREGAAIGVPAQRGRIVHHLETEAVLLAFGGAGHLHVLHAAMTDVVHGERGAVEQALAVEQQVTVAQAGLAGDEADVLVGRIDIGRADHGRRQHHRVRARAAVAAGRDTRMQAARRVEHRVVVHRVDIEHHRAVGAGRHARTATHVGHADAEAVLGHAVHAVVGVGEQVALGVVEALAHGDRDTVEVQRAVRRQAEDGDAQRGVLRVAAAVRHDVLAHVAGIDGI